ncbi:MAG: hypothetical protein RL291_2112 [Pseudomonadota bacterium]
MSSSDNDKAKTQVHGAAQGAATGAAGAADGIQTYIAGAASDRPVGRVSVIAGPGQGQVRTLYAGTNSIGRDPQQNRIAFDYDDTYMSRHEHAVITVDAVTKKMVVIDRGKPNRVQVNGEPLIGERAVTDKDLVQVGRTFLKFELG